MVRYPLALLLCISGQAAADDVSLKVSAADYLPKLKSLTVVEAGQPGPGAAKHKALASATRYGEAINLKGDGPFDLWWTAADSMPIRMVAGLKADKKNAEIKIQDYVGIVSVRGDGLPRPTLVIITSQDDPGPDEKGHRPVQTAKEYKVDMVVPDGFYALWITPDSGARARKVNDRFRVVAGKTVNLD